MAEENEDFGAGGDFRSKPDDMNDTAEDQGEDKDTPAARRADEYTRVLLAEKLSIDEAKHPVALKLLDAEITKVQTEGRGTRREPKYVNIYRDKPVKIACRVLVPLKDHPKFNFMGKLLGPKGNSLKRLQDDTMCKMSILGRGSMRDSKKEEELRNSLDTKYAHLSDDLHVEVTALGPPAEAYARIAFALTELRKYLTPDGSDEISHSQLREMGLYEDRPKPRSGPPGARPGMRGPPMSQAAARPSMPMRPGPRGPAPRGPGPGPRGTPGKSNALSILERARAAIEQNYEEPYDEPYEPEQAYDDYPTSGPSRPGFGGNRFGGSNYNSDYYDNGSDNFRVVAIPGIQQRAFVPVDSSTSKITVKIFSKDTHSSQVIVTRSPYKIQFADVNGYISVVYDINWWLAYVMEKNEELDEVESYILSCSWTITNILLTKPCDTCSKNLCVVSE